MGTVLNNTSVYQNIIINYTVNSERLSAICRSFRVILFVLLLMLSTTHIFLQLFSILLPLALISPSCFARVTSHITAFWHRFTVALCEHLLRVRVVITGNPPAGDGATLILMNHRTRLDWLFFFSVQARYGSLSNYRVCLKQPLKHMIGAGWVIQTLVFLFVNRRWEEDKITILRCLQYYFRVRLKPQILLFPEGTDFNRRSQESSDKFAVANNLPKLRYLLQPRTNGFAFLYQKLTECADMSEIVDVTVGYPFNVCQSEIGLLGGNIPREIHFHMETIPTNSLPTDKNLLISWFRDHWKRKDELLSRFEYRKQFSDDRSNTTRSRVPESFTLLQVASVVFWTSHLVVSNVLFVQLPFLRIHYLISLLIYLICFVTFSGIDVLIPKLQRFHERLMTKSRD